jgi:hypothetical protein
MAGKTKNIYLALALICFIGIILIFVFDGYLGLYDTATITANEQTQVITPEQWQQGEKNLFTPSTSVAYGQQGIFSYEIANRWFSSYTPEFSVSVWKNQEKIDDLIAQDLHLKAFKSVQIAWNFIPTLYLPDGLAANASADFTIVIKHGDIERKLLVYVYGTADQSGIKIPPPGSR